MEHILQYDLFLERSIFSEFTSRIRRIIGKYVGDTQETVFFVSTHKTIEVNGIGITHWDKTPSGVVRFYGDFLFQTKPAAKIRGCVVTEGKIRRVYIISDDKVKGMSVYVPRRIETVVELNKLLAEIGVGEELLATPDKYTLIQATNQYPSVKEVGKYFKNE